MTLFLGGWLPIIDIAPFNWIPGPIWFAAKIGIHPVLLLVGACDVPALSLRPIDAAWLESIPAILAALGRSHRWCAGHVRLAAETLDRRERTKDHGVY